MRKRDNEGDFKVVEEVARFKLLYNSYFGFNEESTMFCVQLKIKIACR